MGDRKGNLPISDEENAVDAGRLTSCVLGDAGRRGTE